MTITASAPAKLILAGEHAVVYGYPALVAAIEKRTSVTWQPREDMSILVIDRNGEEFTWSYQEISDTGEAMLQAAKLDEAPGAYLRLCLSIALRVHNPRHGWQISISSASVLGSGFGSSAATAAALIAGGIAAVSGSAEVVREKLFQLVMEVERVMHGTPSGIDPTAVIYGGLLQFQKTVSGPKIETLQPHHSPKLWTYFSGKPHESSRELIEFVRALWERDAAPVDAEFVQMQRAAESMRHCLVESHSWDGEAFAQAIRSAHEGLQAIGVVSPSVAKKIEDWNDQGVAAKICGAGGRSAGCGVVMLYADENIVLPKTESAVVARDGVTITIDA